MKQEALLSQSSCAMLRVCQSSTYQYNTASALLLVTLVSDLRTSKCCTVVFGVTLRLLVINTLSSISRDQQTPLLTAIPLPAMSVINLPRSRNTVFITPDCHSVDSMPWSEIPVENSDYFTSYLHSMPLLGRYLSEYCYNAWYGKTRIMWLLISTEYMHERDRRTDRRTPHRPHDDIGREAKTAHFASQRTTACLTLANFTSYRVVKNRSKVQTLVETVAAHISTRTWMTPVIALYGKTCASRLVLNVNYSVNTQTNAYGNFSSRSCHQFGVWRRPETTSSIMLFTACVTHTLRLALCHHRCYQPPAKQFYWCHISGTCLYTMVTGWLSHISH